MPRSIVVARTADGPGADYPLTSGSTWNTNYFSQSSFSVPLSPGQTLTGGSDDSDATLSLGSPVVTQYSYDALDDLTSVVQGGSHQRTFTYNSLSQLITSNNPETGQVSYVYDADGNLQTKTDARSVIVTYSYDNLNRLTGKSYSNGDSSISYSYDGSSCLGEASCFNVGRRTGMTDGAGTEAWSYDPMGRVWANLRTTNSVAKTTNYTYNPDGSVATLTYPSGRTVNNSYDSAGRPISAVDQAHAINYATAAAYAPQGALSAVTFGYTSTFAGINLNMTYNQRLQPVEIKAWSTAGVALDLSYNFNVGVADNGNVAAITNNNDSTRSQTFAYDGLNRLLTAQTVNSSSANCWDLAFDYDIWGNLTNQDVVGSGPCYASGFSIGVDGNNHVMGFGYDAAGNVTSDGHNSYAWNGAGELKTAAGVTYTYDGDGQRVEKSSGTLYWYGQGGEVLDESDASGNITNEYVYFAGKRIAWRDSSNNIHYYAEDFLGSSRVITTSAGAVCYDADFYPFGGERTFTNTCSQSYKFTGKERDAETGNDYFGARFYSSSFGRFISPDTSERPDPIPYVRLSDPQSLNRYGYVGNNASSRRDPDGHAWVCGETTATIDKTSGALVVHANCYELPDLFLAVQQGTQIAEPGVNVAFQGLRAFGYVVAAPAMVAAECAAGSPSCTKGNVALALIPGFGGLEDAVRAVRELGLSAREEAAISGVLKQIDAGTTNGEVFRDDFGKLPPRPTGYWTRYTVPLAGQAGRGDARLLLGKAGEIFYTPDHYATFIRIR